MGVIINPGTGPIADATRQNAEKNIECFIADLGLTGKVEVTFVKECRETQYDNKTHTFSEGAPDGRFEFELTYEGRSIDVEMPGLPEHRVRYVGTDDQNIWDFPRLYVGGSSWVWCYGAGVAADALTGRDDDE